MGYTHGTKWDNETIEKEIKRAMEYYKIDVMPTNSQLVRITGSTALSNAIAGKGGFKYWANKLGLKMSNCETRLAKVFEDICEKDLISMGFECERMSTKYPYDILANAVKIDVKCSHLYNGQHGDFYTFNLEKSKPTCDIYVAYCLSENRDIVKTYIIPAVVMQGKTQLSIGEITSKYDCYKDAWDIIKQYDEFYSKFTESR